LSQSDQDQYPDQSDQSAMFLKVTCHNPPLQMTRTIIITIIITIITSNKRQVIMDERGE